MKEVCEERRRENDAVVDLILKTAQRNSEDIKKLIDTTVKSSELKDHVGKEMNFHYWQAGLMGTVILLCLSWFYGHEKIDEANSHMNTQAVTEMRIETKHQKEILKEIKESLKEIQQKLH